MAPSKKPALHLDPEQMRSHADAASRMLRTLGNDNRLMILCLLAQGERSVGQLNERLPLSQSALSQHLAVLRHEGLVDTRRDAQSIYYTLTPGPASRIIQTLHDIYCGNGAAH